MARANLDVDGLSNSQVDDMETIVQKFLRDKFNNESIDVTLYDSELDEEDGEE